MTKDAFLGKIDFLRLHLIDLIEDDGVPVNSSLYAYLHVAAESLYLAKGKFKQYETCTENKG